MFNLPVTKTQIAKYGAKMIVAGTVAQKTEDLIVEHTDVSEDNIIVDAGTTMFGLYVAGKLQPVTDAIVEYPINKIQSWMQNRQNSKNNTAE